MKKLMLICAPVSSRSGYGSHARDLVWAFLDSDKYEIKIIMFVGENVHEMHLIKIIQMTKELLIVFYHNHKLIDSQIFM
tara:strand:- start:212 stop:448 length:237 start_codon:yes stop_codon:yes gene_type:complete